MTHFVESFQNHFYIGLFILLLIDTQLALIVLVPLPLVSVAGWAYSRRYHEGTERLQESWADAATL